jgi:hypothetical protein
LDIVIVLSGNGKLLLHQGLEGRSKAICEGGDLDVIRPGILCSSLIEEALKPDNVSRKALFTLADVCEFVTGLLLRIGVVVDTLQKGEDFLMIPSLGGLCGVKKRKRQALLTSLKPVPCIIKSILSHPSIFSNLCSHGRQPSA